MNDNLEFSDAGQRAATATAHPNIAVSKYWGKRDSPLNLPAVPSVSLTVAPFQTTTTVVWGVEADEVQLNGVEADKGTRRKVLQTLSRIDPGRPPCRVISNNNFPTAAGLASSSSGLAALVLAGAAAARRELSPAQASVLARQGSGSACRSIFGGWALWRLGEREDGTDCHAEAIAPPEHWEVRMVVALVARGRKAHLSTDAMLHSAATSPYHPAWVAQSPAEIEPMCEAIRARDLEAVGQLMERSTLRMHAAMMASDPPLLYWAPGTLAAMELVHELRRRGVGAWYTMDAGPNVKILCAGEDAPGVAAAVETLMPSVTLSPGPGARVVS